MSDGLNIELLGVNNCEYFAQQRDYETGLMRAYNNMLLAVALAVTASIVGLIIAIAVKEWGITAATSIGTVVSGAAVKFILDRRRDCQLRINKWIQAIQDNDCE
jgi:hypothetical protein